jgi:hypothetical protein
MLVNEYQFGFGELFFLKPGPINETWGILSQETEHGLPCVDFGDEEKKAILEFLETEDHDYLYIKDLENDSLLEFYKYENGIVVTLKGKYENGINYFFEGFIRSYEIDTVILFFNEDIAIKKAESQGYTDVRLGKWVYNHSALGDYYVGNQLACKEGYLFYSTVNHTVHFVQEWKKVKI